MTFVALAVLAGLLWWLWRSRGAWRPALAAVVLAGLVGAVAASLRGAWPIGLASLAIALWAGLFVRRRPEPEAADRPRASMSEAEARALLGVEEGATASDVEAAYRRLMRRAHPDLGGSTGLAAQLNAARAVLTRR